MQIGKIAGVLMVVMMAVAALFIAVPSEAVHRGGGNLACGSCHTMHNSQGGSMVTTVLGAGGLVLLRGSVTTRQDMAKFCLNCHAEDGSMGGDTFDTGISPPKVYRTSISWTESNTGGFSSIGAGGDFQWELTTDYSIRGGSPSVVGLGYGHSVGISSGAVTAPGGTVSITGFSCTTCHDAHGAPAWSANTWTNGSTINIFRNLKTDPDANATGVTLSGVSGWAGSASGWKGTTNWAGVGTSTARNHIWPDRNISGVTQCTATTCNTYYSPTAQAADGMSGWCAQCHPNWHEATVAANADGNDWRRHPVNYPLVDAAGSQTSGGNVTIFITAHYTDTGMIPYYDRLPVADTSGSPSGAVYGDNFTASTGDKIFCLSCHFAHAGPYFDGLRWDYLSSTNVGNMTGKGIASDKGCQQCHDK